LGQGSQEFVAPERSAPIDGRGVHSGKTPTTVKSATTEGQRAAATLVAAAEGKAAIADHKELAAATAPTKEATVGMYDPPRIAPVARSKLAAP
jgi:hypothetical protein